MQTHLVTIVSFVTAALATAIKCTLPLLQTGQ